MVAKSIDKCKYFHTAEIIIIITDGYAHGQRVNVSLMDIADCLLTGSPVNPILPSIPGFPGGPGSNSGIFPGANNVVRLQLHTPGGPLGPDTPDLTS